MKSYSNFINAKIHDQVLARVVHYIFGISMCNVITLRLEKITEAIIINSYYITYNTDQLELFITVDHYLQYYIVILCVRIVTYFYHINRLLLQVGGNSLLPRELSYCKLHLKKNTNIITPFDGSLREELSNVNVNLRRAYRHNLCIYRHFLNVLTIFNVFFLLIRN